MAESRDVPPAPGVHVWQPDPSNPAHRINIKLVYIIQAAVRQKSVDNLILKIAVRQQLFQLLFAAVTKTLEIQRIADTRAGTWWNPLDWSIVMFFILFLICYLYIFYQSLRLSKSTKRHLHNI